jgi:CheY-like chemotaxis protein
VGLTVVRSLVERHGGTVEATSEGLGKGAVLTVRLPVAAARPEAPTDHEPPRSSVTESALRIRRVLVVDDNRHAAETLGAVLAEGGYEISVAHDGPTALQLCEDRPVDLAILDLGMPGMDGFEVARRLRERFRSGGPILVALTGYGGSAYRDRALATGFDVHLLKPVSPEAIHALLREARRRVG